MKGFAMIEVMLSLALFLMVMLYFSEQQIRLRHSLLQAYYKQLAVHFAVSLKNLFKANEHYVYRLSEFNKMRDEVRELLPTGDASMKTQQGKSQLEVCWILGKKRCISYPLQ